MPPSVLPAASIRGAFGASAPPRISSGAFPRRRRGPVPLTGVASGLRLGADWWSGGNAAAIWSEAVTLLWFIVWLIWNTVGDNEPLTFDPVNFWAGWLLLALALDLGANHARR